MSRKAGARLLDRAVIHDLGESMAMAGLITVPQIFTADEVNGQQLALQAGAGIGAAMLTRPVARSGGRALGRMIDSKRADKVYPADIRGHFESLTRDIEQGNQYAKYYHGLGMPILKSSRQAGYNAQLRQAIDYQTPNGPMHPFLEKVLRASDPLVIDRSNAYNTVNGRKLTGMEADLGVIAGAFGDNVAQALVQLGLGAVM